MNFPVLYQIPVNEMGKNKNVQKCRERVLCSSILIMASAFNFKTDNYLINETNKTDYEQMYYFSRIFLHETIKLI